MTQLIQALVAHNYSVSFVGKILCTDCPSAILLNLALINHCQIEVIVSVRNPDVTAIREVI